MNVNAVFEGGGVKGIGLVGAVCYFEERGYIWEKVAGTSSGSIIASLLAVGYKSSDLKRILMDLNYKSFMNKTSLQSLPIVGDALGILFEKGLYSGDEIENWMEKILSEIGKTRFRDVSINGESRLKIIATDITGRKMLILPDDLINYEIDPLDFKISKAVRMSTSIPLYFRPYQLYNEGNMSYIVDGGVTSNFPIWIFDSKNSIHPTLGFKIIDPPSHTSLGKRDIISYVLDIVNTMIDQSESQCIQEPDLVRTITIPSGGVKTTDFNITKEQAQRLFEIGYKEAGDFYATWSFDKYVKFMELSKREVYI